MTSRFIEGDTINSSPEICSLLYNMMTKLASYAKELCLSESSALKINELCHLSQKFVQNRETQPTENHVLQLDSVELPLSQLYEIQGSRTSLVSILNLKDSQTEGSYCHLMARGIYLTKQQQGWLREFMNRFMQALECNIGRIHKYEGKRKLKYLVETVVKQIFFQIMHISYEIKVIVSHPPRTLYSDIYYKVTLLQFQLQTLLRRHVYFIFHYMKRKYFSILKQQSQLVTRIKYKCNVLNRMFRRNKFRNKSLAFDCWRKNIKLASKQEREFNNCLAQSFMMKLVQMIKAMDCRAQWNEMEVNLVNQTLKKMIKGCECEVMSLNSAISGRSAYSIESDCSCEMMTLTIENQIQKAIHEQTVQCAQTSSHSIIVLPLYPLKAVAIISWPKPHPQSSLSSNCIMIRSIMNFLEMIRPFLVEVVGIESKIREYQMKAKQNQFQKLVVGSLLAHDTLSSQEQKLVYESMNVRTAFCFLKGHSTPLWRYGEEEDYIISEEVLQMVYKKFQRKQYLCLDRNCGRYYILPLKRHGVIVATFHLKLRQHAIYHHQFIYPFATSLMLSHLNTPKLLDKPEYNIEQESYKVPFSSATAVLQSQNMVQLQQNVAQLFRNESPNSKIFMKILYSTGRECAASMQYWCVKGESIRLVTLRLKRQDEIVQFYQQHALANLLLEKPLFLDSKLHIYENETTHFYIRSHPFFDTTHQPIGYLILGFFEKPHMQEELLPNICSLIAQNRRVYGTITTYDQLENQLRRCPDYSLLDQSLSFLQARPILSIDYNFILKLLQTSGFPFQNALIVKLGSNNITWRGAIGLQTRQFDTCKLRRLFSQSSIIKSKTRSITYLENAGFKNQSKIKKCAFSYIIPKKCQHFDIALLFKSKNVSAEIPSCAAPTLQTLYSLMIDHEVPSNIYAVSLMQGKYFVLLAANEQIELSQQLLNSLKDNLEPNLKGFSAYSPFFLKFQLQYINCFTYLNDVINQRRKKLLGRAIKKFKQPFISRRIKICKIVELCQSLRIVQSDARRWQAQFFSRLSYNSCIRRYGYTKNVSNFMAKLIRFCYKFTAQAFYEIYDYNGISKVSFRKLCFIRKLEVIMSTSTLQRLYQLNFLLRIQQFCLQKKKDKQLKQMDAVAKIRKFYNLLRHKFLKFFFVSQRQSHQQFRENIALLSNQIKNATFNERASLCRFLMARLKALMNTYQSGVSLGIGLKEQTDGQGIIQIFNNEFTLVPITQTNFDLNYKLLHQGIKLRNGLSIIFFIGSQFKVQHYNTLNIIKLLKNSLLALWNRYQNNLEWNSRLLAYTFNHVLFKRSTDEIKFHTAKSFEHLVLNASGQIFFRQRQLKQVVRLRKEELRRIEKENAGLLQGNAKIQEVKREKAMKQLETLSDQEQQLAIRQTLKLKTYAANKMQHIADQRDQSQLIKYVAAKEQQRYCILSQTKNPLKKQTVAYLRKLHKASAFMVGRVLVRHHYKDAKTVFAELLRCSHRNRLY